MEAQCELKAAGKPYPRTCPVCKLGPCQRKGAAGYPNGMNKTENQMFLIRVTLGLNPIHDPIEAIRVLYEDGREAFEKLRGEKCDHAHEWKP